MTTTYKIALGPDRPNEKQLGKAISAPPCHRCIPVYPLRYGIADRALDKDVFPTLDTKGYPALASGKAYGLRVLRPGTYVYLCYFENGRMWTQHYQVTEDVRFARIWWSRADETDATPGRHARPDTVGAKSFLSAPDSKTAESVYLMVSETLLTHHTLWDIETNKDGLRDALAVKIQPGGGATQKHAFNAALLGNAAPELVAPAVYGTPMHYGWSEIRFSATAPNHNNILGNMYIELRPRMDVTPLAVALPDPIGIASELHYLVTDAVAIKTKYAGRNAHKLQSGTLIANYFEAMTKQTASSPELTKILAKQRGLVNYAGAISFPDTYSRKIKEFEKAIATAVNDCIAWVRLIDQEKLLGKALRCFDLRVIHNARDYENAVFQCVGGLVHTKEGAQVLGDLIAKPADKSPYWLALANGSEILLARLQSSAGYIAKNMFEVMDKFMEEHAITPATNALIGLLQVLPQAKQADVLVRRLRHVMEIRANATIVVYDVSLVDLQRAAYEFQGYQTLGGERAQGWKMPSPKVNQTDVLARVLVYDWVKTAETTYRELDEAPADRAALPAPRAIHMEGNIFINMLDRIRGPGGHFFTGLGGFLALKGLSNAWTDFKKLKKSAASVGSVVGAISAVVGAGIEIGSTAIAIGAGGRGNTALATSMRIHAAKWGVAVFGAVGAGLAAIADSIRAISAFSDSNPQQGGMLLGAALAGGALAVATWAGGSAVAATISGGGAAVAVLGLTPLGWAVVAGVAVVLVIGFAFGADMAKHGPVEIWLKHSAWGVGSRHYTNREELDAVHSLYYRPRLTPEWDQSFGYSVGTLRISCQLPGINDMPGDRFQTKLALTLRGNKLTQVNGPIAYVTGTSPIDYRLECLVTPLGGTGRECGWAIQMHEDTEVALEYLYFPDPEQQPGLALLQPHAPTPLVFTSSGWFTNPIDSAKLEPVGAPNNVRD
ncbi:toxin VasX [Achromobacter spanius]|uniref:toxin VasX n=1 Tax=Achromobacter spanius TaxID=217203 RepID=UPI003F694152